MYRTDDQSPPGRGQGGGSQSPPPPLSVAPAVCTHPHPRPRLLPSLAPNTPTPLCLHPSPTPPKPYPTTTHLHDQYHGDLAVEEAIKGADLEGRPRRVHLPARDRRRPGQDAVGAWCRAWVCKGHGAGQGRVAVGVGWGWEPAGQTGCIALCLLCPNTGGPPEAPGLQPPLEPVDDRQGRLQGGGRGLAGGGGLRSWARLMHARTWMRVCGPA